MRGESGGGWEIRVGGDSDEICVCVFVCVCCAECRGEWKKDGWQISDIECLCPVEFVQ